MPGNLYFRVVLKMEGPHQFKKFNFECYWFRGAFTINFQFENVL